MSEPTSTPATPRRAFLAGAAAIGLAPLALAGCGSPAAGPQTPDAGAAATGARRRLGPVEVYPVGLGCQWKPGPANGQVSDFFNSDLDRSAAVALIHRAIDRGVSLIDTAEVYGPFVSEEIVGEALQGRRDKVVLESKFGFDIDPATGANNGPNSRPDHIRTAVEGSLRRLRTERIDILLQHRVDPRIPIEDVAGVVKTLIAEGKVGHFGLSEPGPGTIRRAHAVTPLAVIQNEYSMAWRGPEAEILPLCEELDVGLVCWGPLAYGLLGGLITAQTRFGDDPEDDFRAGVPRMQPAALAANMRLVETVRTWAERKSVTPAQLALAWLLAQKPFVVPIPGTTKAAHLDENIAAADIVFTAAELAELSAALAATPITGDRLPSPVQALSGVEAPPVV